MSDPSVIIGSCIPEKRRRVGKIAVCGAAAWARRTRDFAHADAQCNAPLPTPPTRAREVIE
jgi:hypothetical protein